MNRWNIITPEYPPQIGGVADFTSRVAAGLIEAGDHVAVWGPDCEPAPQIEETWVHRECGTFRVKDLIRIDRKLKKQPASGRLLVQWVPHGYGWRSMNLAFCIWVWLYSLRGNCVEVVVHEPFLSFREGSLKQDMAAVVHRLMLMFLLKASRRIWLSTPAWEKMLRPYALGRNIQFQWVPVSSNIPVCSEPAAVARFRERLNAGGTTILGHFSTYGVGVTNLLDQILPALLESSSCVIVLLGQGGDRYLEQFALAHPALKSQLFAPGRLLPEELSACLTACDVIVQPYPDGVTSRRTSIMAALSHGLPAVTTLGHLSESFWADCDAVVVAPASRPLEFVSRTRELLGNQSEIKRLKVAAQAFYQRHFDIGNTINRLRAEIPCEG